MYVHIFVKITEIFTKQYTAHNYHVKHIKQISQVSLQNSQRHNAYVIAE